MAGGLFSVKDPAAWPAFKALASSLLLARVSVQGPPLSSKEIEQRGSVKQAGVRESASPAIVSAAVRSPPRRSHYWRRQR